WPWSSLVSPVGPRPADAGTRKLNPAVQLGERPAPAVRLAMSPPGAQNARTHGRGPRGCRRHGADRGPAMSDDRTHATPPATVPANGADAAAPVSTQLRTVALCDLVDSTALVERLGDRRAAELFRRHDRVARDLLHRHHGREIDKTDGFLALFERPIQAVAFALDYQRALRDLATEEKAELAARVGVHVGDVLLWENDADDVAKGAKPTEVEGLAKPLAARLMHLARPGQVLLSGVAHNLAQRAQDELGPLAEKVRWPIHGRYRFKG